MSFRLLRSAVAVAMLVCASACGGETEPASVSPSADSGTGADERCPTHTQGCALPPGLVCPKGPSPHLVGWASPVDRSCGVDDDCASVVFTTSCNGNTFALGVNNMSVAAAKAAADVCYRGLRQCGTPATESLAETGTPDGGSSYEQPIGAYCAAGTCKTHYL